MPGPRREVEYCSCGGTTVTEYDENGRMSWGGNCLHLDGVEYHKIPAPKVSPDARIAADVRKDIQPTCHFARPGRGDCAHYVGLPPMLDETTTDVYGKPNGWCWWCWRAYQLDDSRAECSRLRATLEQTQINERLRSIKLTDELKSLRATLESIRDRIAALLPPPTTEPAE